VVRGALRWPKLSFPAGRTFLNRVLDALNFTRDVLVSIWDRPFPVKEVLNRKKIILNRV
jgi:hypothetical protein